MVISMATKDILSPISIITPTQLRTFADLMLRATHPSHHSMRDQSLQGPNLLVWHH